MTLFIIDIDEKIDFNNGIFGEGLSFSVVDRTEFWEGDATKQKPVMKMFLSVFRHFRTKRLQPRVEYVVSVFCEINQIRYGRDLGKGDECKRFKFLSFAIHWEPNFL